MSETRELATFQLAVLRTELSNSRALLSYTQASIALLVSAIAFMNLFDLSQILHLLCWLVIILAIIVFARGIFRYRRTRALIEHHRSLVNES